MLRDILDRDLDEIRRWRNSPEVRHVMFTDHEITRDEHLSWWKNVKEDKTRKHLIYVWDGKDAGVVNYFDIEKNIGECHWGFYLSSDIDDQLLRMQIWQSLEKEAIEYAFNKLNCKRLVCESFEFNQPVIEMHKRFGFEEVAIEVRSKDGVQQNVVITELTPEKFYKDLHGIKSSPDSFAMQGAKPEFTRFLTRCAFLGSSNLDFLIGAFEGKASEYDVHTSFTEVPYGQYMIQANDPDSQLYQTAHDYIVFIERVEDFLKASDVLSVDILPVLEERWLEYLGFIRKARNNLSGMFLVANPACLNSWITSLDPAVSENKRISRCFEKMNSQLLALCHELSDIYVIDLAGLVHKVGRNVAHPGKYWYMARAPFSIQFNNSLSQHILGMMLAIEAKTARVVALDLDNTLWKGVIGDDGIEGIAIGGDYPGNAYQAIQNVLKSFRERGIALVLCSKNTEHIAFQVFETHPDMVLKKGDLTAWRVNWIPKPQNLKELSAELDLGLVSFCFIDDNPVEREEMRMSLPEVFVPEMPDEISEWPEYILNLPELADIELTEEDKKRAEQYKIRSEIKRGEAQAASRDDFLRTLQMLMSIEVLSESNRQRVLQLIKKTNQFNVTSRRYSESDLKKLLKQGECYAVRLKDRLGSNEIIGVLIIVSENQNIKIDTLLLSCRVLGRGVETAILGWLYSYVASQGYKRLIGEIVPTERNLPVREIYLDHGFSELGNNMYELNLSERKIEIPDWIGLE